ncbi:DNA-directed RNA polymerase I subunit rpa2,DNA-directed RNA polymerase I subunit RPA2,Probable DNA-directed RNA polymerase I subunit RPA2,DNA-directed RNA polymerase I subunit RPA135 [Acanthosepion pharaonis]|uniref:DNA-directed RNA polymerase subunit beta n=1 Tax=Acanthosepion pharaonis TaxID=158019 RepID=A0A812CDK6_ACAPH|nr:DNA-directed RNA polymerase I subunit rpa2,DNA-directed RNA polymerase I subunit RPA2,Probable DNA-directed RNA polymerase I subunit RPA2,DNA-directed RNA polymerase I subunit RPA135 [Sepia pharaonis]
MLLEGIYKAVKKIRPCEFQSSNGDCISISIMDAFINNPAVSKSNILASTQQIFPAECRLRMCSYAGALVVTFGWSVNGVKQAHIQKNLGNIPIMVKSSACNLIHMTPRELVNQGEETEEAGGYFIINGNEKIIRQLITQRKNYPFCIQRDHLKRHGKLFTEYGLHIRCEREEDGYSQVMVMHYLKTGTVHLSFQIENSIYVIPAIFLLKALIDVNDKFIYDELLKGRENDTFYKSCIVLMLRTALNEDLICQSDVLHYLGKTFRVKLNYAEWYSDEEIGKFLLRDYILIHMSDNLDKFNLLVYMIQKLYAFVQNECAAENRDSIMNQEVLQPGKIYQIILMAQLQAWLYSLRFEIEKVQSVKGLVVVNEDVMHDVCRYGNKIVNTMQYFLATGNVPGKLKVPLQQSTGLVIIADRLNHHRFISHFRSIHRGSFFIDSPEVSVRKLLPEAWGFLCPVHTPDGTPCGLLNHMTIACQVVNKTYDVSHFPALLGSLGMLAINDKAARPFNEFYPVMLEGQICGCVHENNVTSFCEQLRYFKLQDTKEVPVVLEICLVPKTDSVSQYPGIYLFYGRDRLIRPVLNLALEKIEFIGTFEQVYMDIAVTAEGIYKGITTHIELKKKNMLSFLGNLIPFSDFNQSPRNMYQCQMGKQTVGMTPHSLSHRNDFKMYRLQTPQSPIVRNTLYNEFEMDEYPLGTNAVVAVLSYTGYDMEDAMVLNKGSVERGFSHGSIYKTMTVDLNERSRAGQFRFANIDLVDGLDADGLPPVGTYLKKGSYNYSFINLQTSEQKNVEYPSNESGYVDQIRILSNDTGTADLTHASITLRIPRNPIIGDKFSSRHGQKGICSILWPSEDMPFTESGITPDIIFNPHGFPSRMTVGMMIEFMAGKSASLHGIGHDSTPFSFSEDNSAADYFGKMLTAAGYNFYGTERMYSGITGEELEADIFIGIVYYQKLRHMVSDKFQVRTVGHIDSVTHQPVKGRKRGGGVRFGEMERDALIAHGSSFLLQDRLMNCTDRCVSHVCVTCGNLLSPSLKSASLKSAHLDSWICQLCKSPNSVKVLSIPYVMRYLTAELASMNINMKLDIKT